MTTLAGIFGSRADSSVVLRMLAAGSRGGGARKVLSRPGIALGVRGRGDVVLEAGELSAWAGYVHAGSVSDLDALDGEVAFAKGDGRSLSIVTDPFGHRTVYLREHAGSLYFATDLASLLEIAPASLDYVALHLYLTCSFVPGPRTVFREIRTALPGSVMRVTKRTGTTESPYVAIEEKVNPRIDLERGARELAELGRAATARRLSPSRKARVALFLSGGVDSSAVGAWLVDSGAKVQAFSLDFGPESVELDEAKLVAKTLGLPFATVRANADDVRTAFTAVVDALQQPFGDPVTAPHWLLGRAAKKAGIEIAFNGEGGDQLFGGWTNKPLIAAAAFDGRHLEREHLTAYHRFYGQEDALYTQSFRAAVDEQMKNEGLRSDPREALLAPTLSKAPKRTTFLGRLRTSDIRLKGRFNLLPRAERIGAANGLSVRAPLFDRGVVEHSLTLAPSLKLAGSREKVVLKRAIEARISRDILERRKFGMTVPAVSWLTEAFAPVAFDLLGEDALVKRGFFSPRYVERLLGGRERGDEPRLRRLGDRVWTLLMLEAFLRRFVDGKKAI